MALIVESGIGLPDAESFCSVERFREYHTLRGREAAVERPEDEAIEAHLRLATDYLHQVYGSRWDGTRATEAQSLDWPRYGVRSAAVQLRPAALLSHAEVPQAVIDACAELALRSLRGDPLLPDAPSAPRAKRQTVGPLTVEYETPPPRTATHFAAIDASLRPYLRSGPGVLLERA